MTECTLGTVVETATAAIRATVPIAELTDFFGKSFSAIAAELSATGVPIAGPPYSRYRGIPTGVIDVEAGFPVGQPIEDSSKLTAGELPAGDVVESLYVGAYDGLAFAYAAMAEWMAGRDITPADEMWEYYLTGPAQETDPAKWQTKIIWPVASPDA